MLGVGSSGQRRLSSGTVVKCCTGAGETLRGRFRGGTWETEQVSLLPESSWRESRRRFTSSRRILSSSFTSWLPSPWLCWQPTLRVEPKTGPQGEWVSAASTRSRPRFLETSKPFLSPPSTFYFLASNLTSVGFHGAKGVRKSFPQLCY